MSTSKYHGRHRPSAEADPRHPEATPVADRTAHVAAGRHRAPGGRSVPRLAGTGVLLPTVATAAVVLTTTGAHLGAVGTPSAPGTVSAAQTASAAEAAARQQLVESKASSLAAQSRSLTTRAARDAARADAADRAATAKAAADQAAAAAAAAKATAAAKAAAAASAHRWVAPLAVPYTLTSGFGMRWGSMHPGQDFAVPVGSPVMSMSSGTVLFAGWQGGYGNKVEIKYWDGTISWYAHNSQLKVQQGDAVTPGEVVALSGNTGHSTGPHSHIEIHLDGDDTQAGAVPPIPWLTKHGNMPGRGAAGASSAGD